MDADFLAHRILKVKAYIAPELQGRRLHLALMLIACFFVRGAIFLAFALVHCVTLLLPLKMLCWTCNLDFHENVEQWMPAVLFVLLWTDWWSSFQSLLLMDYNMSGQADPLVCLLETDQSDMW